MSPIYGVLADTSAEEHEMKVRAERINAGGIYGPLAIDIPRPANPEPAPHIPAPHDVKPEVVEPPKAKEYTVDEVRAAIKADPFLVETLALAEISREQGPRKGALTALLDAGGASVETKTLIEQALEILSGK